MAAEPTCDPLGALQASPSHEAHSCLWLPELIAGGVNALLPRSSLSLSNLATELSVAVGDSADREQGQGDFNSFCKEATLL